MTLYNGTPITYDEIGNPLTYRDGFTFTWSNGRQLGQRYYEVYRQLQPVLCEDKHADLTVSEIEKL